MAVVTLVEQVKLITTKEEAADLDELARLYSVVATDISERVFAENPSMSAFAMNNRYYAYVRSAYSFKSQLTQSVFKTVAARYKSIDRQMKEECYRIYDKESKKTYSFKKDINWLKKPVVFKRPQADLVRGRDWSWKEGMRRISVATLKGRRTLDYACRPECRLFEEDWEQGGAKLVYHESDRNWYLHISVTKEFPDETRDTLIDVEGHDRGLINLTTTRTSHFETKYEPGADVARVRARYDRTRASLQKKGTKGAKRVLKRISGRENRMMEDVNHRISKTLACGCGKHKLHALEDLTGISFDEDNLKKRTGSGRHDLRGWSFCSLENKLEYKAIMNAGLVKKFDPKYTSQRCPHCGNIDKTARNREKHEYCCPKCGRVWNDDEVGGMNLRELGIRYLKGEDNPSFSKE